MDENFIPCAIYLDLSKAFDTLNFDILINKLKFYGIVGTPLNLLDSYLKNRHQFVDFKNTKSDLQEIRTGVPQGSILGPLFFSICINDLIKSSNLFNYLMYAYDTTLYFNLEDIDSVNMNENINPFRTPTVKPGFHLVLPQRLNQDSILIDLNGRGRIDKVHGCFVFIG